MKCFSCSTFLSVTPPALALDDPLPSRPPGRTFLSGEVGVVTWFVGLVGGETVMLVEVAVVLLLTDAEGLLLSAGQERASNLGEKKTPKNTKKTHQKTNTG